MDGPMCIPRSTCRSPEPGSRRAGFEEGRVRGPGGSAPVGRRKPCEAGNPRDPTPKVLNDPGPPSRQEPCRFAAEQNTYGLVPSGLNFIALA